MNELTKPARIRQITVAIDTSLRALGALETAAALATRRQASLEALFVEDINLFTLASLPFARELDTASGAEREFDESQIVSSLRSHQQRVRKALEQAGEQRRLRTAIRVKRGHYIAEALAAASGVDVLFLASVSRVRYSGSVTTPGPRAQAPVWIIYDGSPGAARALSIAGEMSETNSTPLGVVLFIESDGKMARLTREVEQILGPDSRPRALRIAPSDASKLCQALKSAGCSLLLLPLERSALVADPSSGLLEVLDCPLVVVS